MENPTQQTQSAIPPPDQTLKERNCAFPRPSTNEAPRDIDPNIKTTTKIRAARLSDGGGPSIKQQHSIPRDIIGATSTTPHTLKISRHQRERRATTLQHQTAIMIGVVDHTGTIVEHSTPTVSGGAHVRGSRGSADLDAVLANGSSSVKWKQGTASPSPSPSPSPGADGGATSSPNPNADAIKLSKVMGSHGSGDFRTDRTVGADDSETGSSSLFLSIASLANRRRNRDATDDTEEEHSDSGMLPAATSTADPTIEQEPELATETYRMSIAGKLSALTMQMLDFSTVGLVGREREKRVLDHAFKQILGRVPPNVQSTAITQRPSSRSAMVQKHKRASIKQQPRHHHQQHQQQKHKDEDETKSTAPIIDDEMSVESQIQIAAHSETVRSFVAISGYSGTGKSALAATLKPKCKAHNVFYITGKFDLKQMDEPYSGFRTAMIDLCSQICRLPNEKTQNSPSNETGDTRCYDELRQCILRDLNTDELLILMKLIPNLRDVIGDDALLPEVAASSRRDDESTVVSVGARAQSMQGFKEQSIALKFAFRRFIKIICNYCPLVWMSDDVQWADKASLDMIESWMLDTTISSLMIIVCYRSNLVNRDDANVSGVLSNSSSSNHVSQMLDCIRENRQERFIRYSDLEVNNLSLDNVHAMLKQLLNLHDSLNADSSHSRHQYMAKANSSRHQYMAKPNSSSSELAEIVHKKTDGNVFFVQQFMTMLAHDNLLSYNIGAMRWVWDNDRIRRDTPATMNVVELMKMKLQQIETAQYILPIAACLGSTFSWSLLRATMRGFVEGQMAGHRELYEMLFGGPPPQSEDEWLGILEVYQQEGLIECHEYSDSPKHVASDDQSNPPMIVAAKVNAVNIASAIKASNGDATDASAGTEAEQAVAAAVGATRNNGSEERMSRPTLVSSEYSFIHDKVQEAALDMVPSKSQLSQLQFYIGETLMQQLSPDDLDRSLYTVANLMNRRMDLIPPYPSSPSTSPPTSSPTSQTDPPVNQDIAPMCKRFRMAILNFEAGIKAASHAAFVAAFQYLRTAINLMPEGHWDSHYEMSLELFTCATECAFVSNKFQEMNEYGKQVVSLKDRPITEKIRVYHVLMDGALATATGSKATDTMKVGEEVMAQLGYRYPRNSKIRLMHVIMRVIQLKKSAKKWTIGYLESLQPAQDPIDAITMKTLGKFASMAFVCDQGLQPLILTDIINRTMTKGKTDFAPNAIANMSLMLGPILGDMEAAKMYGSYALNLTRTMNIEDKSAVARATLSTNGFVLNSVRQLEDCKQPLLEAYSLSMATGDVQTGLWCILFYLELCWFTAKSLNTVEADYAKYTRVSIDFNQTKLVENLALRWQMILNLQGRSQHRTLLVGDAFDEVAAAGHIETTHDTFFERNVLRAKVFVSVYFNDYEKAAKHAHYSFDDDVKNSTGYIAMMPFMFFASFASMIVAKQTNGLSRLKRIKYKKLSRKARKILQNVVKKGNPNAVDYLAMLEAERSALKAHGKDKPDVFNDAVKQYQAVIRAWGRAGMIQNQAMANERLAIHLLIEDDEDAAKYHLEQAIKLFSEWGADGKTSQLREQYALVRRT